ncbi:MAG TPA: hypothetical protein DCY07_03430, partial [Rhodospirillaceae bacterium]|nr:hypothetical protein [Rhodospirillaceae bacterium]
MADSIEPKQTEKGRLCLIKKRNKSVCAQNGQNESPHIRENYSRAGFAIAPILYLLTLAGVAGGVLFSSYSQVLRGNINVTNANTTKNDIAAAVTTLSATAVMGDDAETLCPPGSSDVVGGTCEAVPQKMTLFADVPVADAAKLPIDYTIADDTGNPAEVGVFAAAAGVKQLDPWGHYYIYCRWQKKNIPAEVAQPAMAIISAGANATLETECGDATPQGDDQINVITVGTAINRAAVWQQTATGAVYGSPDTKIIVSPEGVITAWGLVINAPGTIEAQTLIVDTATFDHLNLTNPLPVESGGTAAITATGARINLGSGAVGDAVFVAATATAGRNALGGTALGQYLFATTTLIADTASAVRLDLLGASAVGNSLFVAGTAADARTVLGATAMGDYLFSSSAYVAATASDVRTTLLGAGAVGDAVFMSASTDTALTALGGTAVGKGVFTAATATAARTTLGGGAVGSPLFTAPDQPTAWSILGLVGGTGTLDVSISGSVDASQITGTLPIEHGGTSAVSASAALDNLFGNDSVPSTALNLGRIADGSIPSAKMTSVVTAGIYNRVEVDDAGRVIDGSLIVIDNDKITDGVGDYIIASATDGGRLIFSTASAVRMVLDSIGNLGIGTEEPEEKLHIFGGNARISGPSDGFRELQFATSTSAKRWVVAADDETETGSGDSGSDFVIRRYNDAGTVPTTALTIDRATGNALFAGSVAATGGFLGYFTGTFDGTYIGTISGAVLLGADSTHANPQRTGDMTTGFFSDAAAQVSAAISGTERLRITATGITAFGGIDTGAITNAYYLGGTKILHQPASDTTSIGVGGGTLAAQTATNLGNIALGLDALYTNQTGGGNTAIGYRALYYTTTRINTAVGYQALENNTEGTGNVSVGTSALRANTTGGLNTALGLYSLYTNQTGSYNTAVGWRALFYAATGSNTAVGSAALHETTTGTFNAALGVDALRLNTTGSRNTAVGTGAGYSNVSGTNNTIMGYEVARTTLTTGSNNILIGTSSLVDTATAGQSNHLNIGNTIYGDLGAGAVSIGSPTLTPGTSLDLSARTDSLRIPYGTTAQQPAGQEGMVRYNEDIDSIEVYQGDPASWFPLVSSATAGTTMDLGPDATHASPSRPDDITTGLYSATASTVSTAISGTERLIVTTTGTTTTGIVNLAAITDHFAIATVRVLHQPASDATSIGVGNGTFTTHTAAGLGSTAVGYQTLQTNTIGGIGAGAKNTAIGYQALLLNTGSGSAAGSYNNAIGNTALGTNTATGINTGSYNNAIGSGAMNTNTGNGMAAGSYNNAIGAGAMYVNEGAAPGAGSYNNAIGFRALYKNTGAGNTVIGSYALGKTTATYTGSNNVALGYAVGSTTLVSGSSNILIGTSAAVDTPAAGTNEWLNIGNTIYGDLSKRSIALGAGALSAVTTGAVLDMGGATGVALSSMILPKDIEANRPTVPVVGMVRYNTTSNSVEFYQGGTPGWYSLAATTTAGSNTYLGADATHNSPSRSDDITTGLFSDTASTVSIATAGTQRLIVTATGSVGIGTITPAQALEVSGDINLSAITNAYHIANIKVLHQPASDTTSIGVGSETLSAQTATNLHNTAVGYRSLYNNQTGAHNTAVGHEALFSTTTDSNSALGYQALRSTTAGTRNVGIGYMALYTNQGGNYNTAMGYQALYYTTTGYNTAVGYRALYNTTTSVGNVAMGFSALLNNVTGSNNAAFGYGALLNNASGSGNVAQGSYALYANTSGSNNTAVGFEVGRTTLATGSNNILIGTSSLVDTATAGQSNHLNIGNTIFGDLGAGTVGIGSGTINPGVSLDISSRTDAMLIPKGTALQPPAGIPGMVRYNTDIDSIEVYQGAPAGWFTLTSSTTAGSTMYLGADATHNTPSRSDDVTTGLFSATATTVSIATAGAERVRVDANGKVKLGAGAVTAGVALDMASHTDSMLLPKGTVVQRPAGIVGMVRYNTETASVEFYQGSTPGWYSLGTTATAGSTMFLGANATNTSPSRSDDITTGLFSATASTVSIGTAGVQRLIVTATGSVGVGTATPAQALEISGYINLTAITHAYRIANVKVLHQPASDTTSIGVGSGSLAAQTASNLNNTAMGYQALTTNQTGAYSTAIGTQALMTTTTGYNTAVGYRALYGTTTGIYNTAVGMQALQGNTVGVHNVGLGYYTLFANTSGSYNTAIGNHALRNTTGGYNTGVGYMSLYANTSGANNTAIGYEVGKTTLSTGARNILIGTSSLVDTPAAGTNDWLNIGNTIYGNLSTGHVSIGTGATGATYPLTVAKPTAPNDTAIRVVDLQGGADVTLGPMHLALGVIPSAVAGNRYAFIGGGDDIGMRPLILNTNGTGQYGTVGIGAATVTAGTSLDISARTDSIIVPKGTIVQRPTGVEGMMRYNTETASVEFYQGSTPDWVSLAASATAGSTIYLGPDVTHTSPSRSVDVTTGLFSDVAATVKTAISGIERLMVSATGISVNGNVNVATLTNHYLIAGTKVLHQPASDTTSIGLGGGSLAAQTATNLYNTALGGESLTSNTGANNTAVGFTALWMNTTGTDNTASGRSALGWSMTGDHNTAVGSSAMLGATATANRLTGSSNTAVGSGALIAVQTTANANTALGRQAGYALTTGASNLILGYQVGSTMLATGSSNILIGTSNLVDTATAGQNNWLNIGNTIYGNLTTGSIALGAAAVTAGASLDISARTDSIIVPKGTIVQRPTGVPGMVRYNTETAALEVYQGSTPDWVVFGATASNVGTLGTSTATASPYRTGEVNTGLFSPASGVVSVTSLGTERLRVGANGAVTVGAGAARDGVVLDLVAGTGTALSSMILPQDTLENRPTAGIAGMLRYNTSNNTFEGFNGTEWITLSPTTGSIIGEVKVWPTETVPAGYLECRGQAVDRVAYADLFAVIGTTYGVGDGSTTFNLPDYRGEFLRGWAHGTTNDPDKATRTNSGGGVTGDHVGTKQTSALATHTNSVDPPVASSDVVAAHGHTVDPPVTAAVAAEAHTHAVDPPVTEAVAAAAHVHSVNPPSTSVVEAAAHTHSIDPPSTGTNTTGAHTHTLNGGVTISGSSLATSGSRGDTSGVANSAGNHAHAVDIAAFNSVSGGGHGHTVDIAAFDSVSGGGHGHNVDILSFTSSGGGGHGHNVDIASFASGNAGGHGHTTDIAAFNSTYTGSTETRARNVNVMFIIKYQEDAAAAGGGGTLSPQNFSIAGDAVASPVSFDGTAPVELFATVSKIQGYTVADTEPTNGQALVWNTASSQWEPGTASGASFFGANASNTAPSRSDDVTTGLFSSTASVIQTAIAGTERLRVTATGISATGNVNVAAITNYYAIAATKILYQPASDAASIALGTNAGASIASGTNNTVLGSGVASTTLESGSNNILIGTSNAVDTPSTNTSNWLNIGNTIYGDLSTGSIAIGAAAVTDEVALDMSARTDSMIVPKGLDAGRPASPVTGMIRYNTTSDTLEVYQGTTPDWVALGAGGGSGTSELGASTATASPY